MAARHPAWFHPVSFSTEVIEFSLRKFGFLPPVNFIRGEVEFVEAVQTVGKAVFTLQIIMRNKLRPMFIASIHLLAPMVNGQGANEIIQFMEQGYIESDAAESILSLFAVIGELILFLDELGLPIPHELYYHPWSNIYEYNLRDKLFSMGGFERLVEKARLRFIDTGLYTETSIAFENNHPIPYAEVHIEENLVEDPLELVHQRFGVAPHITDAAMRILRKLYQAKRIVPPPEQEHVWL